MGELKDRAQDVVNFLNRRSPFWGEGMNRACLLNGGETVVHWCGDAEGKRVGGFPNVQFAREAFARLLGWHPGDGLPKTNNALSASIIPHISLHEADRTEIDQLRSKNEKRGQTIKQMRQDIDERKKQDKALRDELSCAHGVLRLTRFALGVPRGVAMDQYAGELVERLRIAEKRVGELEIGSSVVNDKGVSDLSQPPRSRYSKRCPLPLPGSQDWEWGDWEAAMGGFVMSVGWNEELRKWTWGVWADVPAWALWASGLTNGRVQARRQAERAVRKAWLVMHPKGAGGTGGAKERSDGSP